MQAFTRHTGRAVPLRRSNVDTDQIIPAEYLKRITRSGFADGLFAAWRRDPSFVLNEARYDGASILVAGPDFGTGSSREHAVWALQEYGFRVVVSSRFGDIFRQNALTAGLLPVQLSEVEVSTIQRLVEADPVRRITVDLVDRQVRAGDLVASFAMDEHARRRLMQGLDDIASTLEHAEEITSYEVRRPGWLPTSR